MSIDRKEKRSKDGGQNTPKLRQEEDHAPPPKETRTKKIVRQETNQKRAVSQKSKGDRISGTKGEINCVKGC